MTGTLWIGDDDDKTVLLPPTSLIDNVYNEIKSHLGDSHSHIIAKLREAYAEGTYLGLDTLDKEAFQLVSELLLNYHLYAMITTINDEKPRIAWLPMVSALKVALIIDKRTKQVQTKNLSVSVLVGDDKKIQTVAWCFQYFLEQLIALPTVSKEEKLRVFSIWANTSKVRNISSIRALINSKMEELESINCLPSPYSKEIYKQFIQDIAVIGQG